MAKQKLNASYKNFEDTFRDLLEKAKKGPLTLKTFLTSLSGRGKLLLLIFLSLGFGQIPGAAIPLGFFIAFLGLRIAIGNNFIWIPQSIREKKLPSKITVKIIQQILNLLKRMKRWSRPRYIWATQHPATRIANGLMIALVGISFALSPPIPVTGLLAFVAIFALAIGLLNDDGIYIFAGVLFALFYFTMVLFLMKYCSVGQIYDWGRRGVAYFLDSF